MIKKSMLYEWYKRTGPVAAHIVRAALGHRTWASVYRAMRKSGLPSDQAARIENEIIVHNLNNPDNPVLELKRWDMSSVCANCPHRKI